ncbi:MAG: hypothetical protein FJ215_13270 [Ignavibacteria bacterium]|nr:hypothetical protein [Ignavibacteria bacterium]
MNRIVILSAALLVALPLASQEQISRTDIVDSLLAYSTAKSNLEFFQVTLLRRAEAFQEFLDHASSASLRNAIKNHYDPSKLLKEISRRCEPQLSLPQLLASLRWYESPVGAKISRSEYESVLASAAKEFSQFRQEEMQKYRTQRRRLLLERLNGHQAMNSDVDDMIATHFRKLLSLTDPQIFGSPGTESVTIKRNVASLLTRLDLQLRETLNALPSFTYRRVTNNELQMYNEFYESAEGASVGGLIAREVRTALENALDGATAELPSPRGRTQP